MLTDITLKVISKMVTDVQGNESKSLVGHIGTHFDVMNKEFPLVYTRRKGIVFDVSSVCDRDIELDGGRADDRMKSEERYGTRRRGIHCRL